MNLHFSISSLSFYVISVASSSLVIFILTSYYFDFYNIFLKWVGKQKLRQIKHNVEQKRQETQDKIPTITSIILLGSDSDSNGKKFGVGLGLDTDIIHSILTGLKKLTHNNLKDLNLAYFSLHNDPRIPPNSEIVVSFFPSFIKKTDGYIGDLLRNKSKLSIKENSYNIL